MRPSFASIQAMHGNSERSKAMTSSPIPPSSRRDREPDRHCVGTDEPVWSLDARGARAPELLLHMGEAIR